MNLRESQPEESPLDWLKWLLALVLVLAGIAGNLYYGHISMPLRMLVWLAILVAAGFVASRTRKGKWVVEFLRDSRMELRKVVWPTREETVQTTLVVGGMVIILALILWGMDGVLVWLIGWLTGQRG
ncbi:MAG: preprotein translocase subunit SecE [Gammaproteobacteria bacterium RIFCSPHIGHO2_12_FULL_45_12]|nr:MAG: preprotein translocase subunit SecE [Gammaproteobacteria bacterium RIFCSPHIGHO2_12_FULL_45_12]